MIKRIFKEIAKIALSFGIIYLFNKGFENNLIFVFSSIGLYLTLKIGKIEVMQKFYEKFKKRKAVNFIASLIYRISFMSIVLFFVDLGSDSFFAYVSRATLFVLLLILPTKMFVYIKENKDALEKNSKLYRFSKKYVLIPLGFLITWFFKIVLLPLYPFVLYYKWAIINYYDFRDGKTNYRGKDLRKLSNKQKGVSIAIEITLICFLYTVLFVPVMVEQLIRFIIKKTKKGGE